MRSLHSVYNNDYTYDNMTWLYIKSPGEPHVRVRRDNAMGAYYECLQTIPLRELHDDYFVSSGHLINKMKIIVYRLPVLEVLASIDSY